MSNGFKNIQNLNIMFPHKYIKLYNTQDDWQQALDNHELEEVAVAAILESRDTTPDKYQYSIRTTNKDNERLGPYNALDPINYFGGLEIIWGYWGWKWKDITYNGETLHGGHFDNIKDTTAYPAIMDGYRLQHIDGLTISTPRVTEVGYFDASNVVSAQNAFSQYVTKINTFDYPKLKNIKFMFHTISSTLAQSDNVLNFPEVLDASNFCSNTVFLYTTSNFAINFGKVQELALPNNIRLNGNQPIYTKEGSIDINKYFKGLENCYDYSKLQDSRNIDSASTSYTANKYNFKLEPTYKGTEILKVPSFGPKSSFKYNGQATFISTGYQGNICYNSLIVARKTRTGVPSQSQQESTSYQKYVEQGLNIDDFKNIIIENPGGFLAGFCFKDNEQLPFYKKLNSAIMYSYCYFKNMTIEFDCTEGFYYPNSENTKKYYTEFFDCYFDNCNITLKNILNSDNINFSRVDFKCPPVKLGFQDTKSLSDCSINFKKSTIEDIDGVTFENCGIKATTNLSNCIVKMSATNAPSWETYGNVSNTSFIGTYRINKQQLSLLGGELSNINIDYYYYSIRIVAQSGDYSSVTITNLTEYAGNMTGKEVKTPILKGSATYQKVLYNPESVQEINYQELICNINGTESTTNNKDLNLSSNTVLTKINLGQGWRTLRIDHAKLVDKDSLYQSIVRREFVPTSSSGNGELWLHRDVWSQYTDEEKTFIQSKFDIVKVIEDESGTE